MGFHCPDADEERFRGLTVARPPGDELGHPEFGRGQLRSGAHRRHALELRLDLVDQWTVPDARRKNKRSVQGIARLLARPSATLNSSEHEQTARRFDPQG